MKRLLWLILFGHSLLQAQWVPPSSPPMHYTWHSQDDICEYMFLGTFHSVSPSTYKPTNMILDKQGNIVWWQKETKGMLDFKVHPNGMMSYNIAGDWVILDTAFQVLDTLRCSSGYKTDVHDLLIEDDHYFLICTEDSIMDLRSLYTRNGVQGDSNAIVAATVIQELDAQKNPVREWHAFDHFDIYDSDTVFFKLPGKLQLNHTNSIFRDAAGNMLLSHRFNHELTYIDWPTGDIIWRMGGGTNNQFSFPNDIGISDQHFAQVLPDGRISVFDNGLYHQPNRARGIIYEVDTSAMTATKVWEYAKPDLISAAYGSFQVRPNGDALVNFGSFLPNTETNIAYLRADSSLVFEIKIENEYWTYRAQCLDLPLTLPRPEIHCYEENGQYFLSVDSSYTGILWSTYETAPTIAVPETGGYQVFVDHGVGRLGSRVLQVSDVTNPCAAVAATEAVAPAAKPAKLLGIYDLSGRVVVAPQPGRLYIERWSDGRSRKLVRWQ